MHLHVNIILKSCINIQSLHEFNINVNRRSHLSFYSFSDGNSQYCIFNQQKPATI